MLPSSFAVALRGWSKMHAVTSADTVGIEAAPMTPKATSTHAAARHIEACHIHVMMVGVNDHNLCI